MRVPKPHLVFKCKSCFRREKCYTCLQHEIWKYFWSRSTCIPCRRKRMHPQHYLTRPMTFNRLKKKPKIPMFFDDDDEDIDR